MLAVSDVIRNDRLAQLYARVLELDSPTVEELAEGIESSTTTVYEDIKHLVEIGLLERVTETQPHRYRASRVDMTIQAGGETFQITRRSWLPWRNANRTRISAFTSTATV